MGGQTTLTSNDITPKRDFESMELSRRQLVILTAAAASCCYDASADEPATAPTTSPSASAPRVVDVGAVAGFSQDRVYDQFREQGLFLIRRDRKLFALSSICTHKGCKVRAQPDQSFFCRCHKSAFDPDGGVLNGPAKRNLPRLAVKLDEQKHVLVNLDREV